VRRTEALSRGRVSDQDTDRSADSTLLVGVREELVFVCCWVTGWFALFCLFVCLFVFVFLRLYLLCGRLLFFSFLFSSVCACVRVCVQYEYVYMCVGTFIYFVGVCFPVQAG
jgi:hypothetical protein